MKSTFTSRFLVCASAIVFSALSLGCNSQDVPQAHKGRMFDKTGAMALWSGGKGFEGPDPWTRHLLYGHLSGSPHGRLLPAEP